ncbi:replication initiation protein [Paraburkholderia sp. BR10879]
MSNALTRAAQGLKLIEKRLISAAIAQSDSVELRKLAAALGPNEGWRVKLSAQEYAAAFAVDQPTAYVQLREAAESIFNKYIRTVEQTRCGEKKRAQIPVGLRKYVSRRRGLGRRQFFA